MTAYVVSMQFTVTDMDTRERVDDERWETLIDRLMTTLLDRESSGGYSDSSTGSTRRVSDHVLDVSVLVQAPNDESAYRKGYNAIWEAVARSTSHVALMAQGGQVWRSEWEQPS